MAIGLAPTEIKFRQLSHTICLPPVKGCELQYEADAVSYTHLTLPTNREV